LNTIEDRGAMSVTDFCLWASIGRTKANEEIRAGHLRSFKVGRRRLIAYEAARNWLQALEQA
jgi:hypothetical protein